ncbi:MAG: hypothetical protein JW915_15500 [Chitinispirillaceae bacterium]|nr:hypothetical protein [Chitinispirillaceae bacterium]
MLTRRGRFPAGFCGRVQIAPDLPEIKGHCIVDCHMHIQSNKCAPKPLQDNQLKRISIVENATNIIPVAGGLWLGGKNEIEIGKIAIKENNTTYSQTFESTEFGYEKDTTFSADATKSSNVPQQKKEKVFTIMVAQMMDMEYAHIAGYEGQKIYHEKDGEVFYYKREFGNLPEKKGKKVDGAKSAKDLKSWLYQYADTRKALIDHQWNLMVMYKYEPRRWRDITGKNVDTKMASGPWDYPFQEVATSKKSGLFCGFKMYPPLGFQPLDPNLPHLWNYTSSKDECFFGRCELENIPILSHCSPGGMTTHELGFYMDFFNKRRPDKVPSSPKTVTMSDVPRMSAPSDVTNVATPHIYGSSQPISNPKEVEPVQQSDAQTSSAAADGTRVKITIDTEKWFYENVVHPRNWRKVLEKFPSLKVCLAHFGGDLWQKKGPQNDWIQEIINLITEKDGSGAYKYPNVYTDVACWDITAPRVGTALKNILTNTPELKKRLLFGSDWHMIKIVSPYCEYNEFCENWKHYLDEIDEKLWVRFSLVNPFEFYGFSDISKLKQINKGLSLARVRAAERIKGFNKILEIQKEVENLKKALEQWDTAGY